MLGEFYQLYKAHRDSRLASDIYLQKYSKEFSKVNLGCSFNPEHPVFENKDSKIILDSAKFIVEELGMKEIRLSIRWDKVWDDGKINFAYYEELFRYFFLNDVNICINVGPIKTMRWPEEHIPLSVINNLKVLPAKKSVLKSDNELSGISKKYLRDLLIFLKHNFSNSELSKIKSIQTNNEAFNKFGNYQWTLDYDLESEFIKIVNSEFPNTKFLLNSSGRNNMRLNLKVIKRTAMAGNRFILGYNYYYKVPGQAEIPILNKLDNLIISFPLTIGTWWLKRICRRQNIQLEVSELQAEPWQHISTPGSSIREFKFTLLRSIQEMLNLNSESKSVIRYWGIEELYTKYLDNHSNTEQQKIIKLIKRINHDLHQKD